MKTEPEIRAMVETLTAFGVAEEQVPAVRALLWVLDEYPQQRPPRPENVEPIPPNVAMPMGPGGFAVRAFGRRPNPTSQSKEGE